MTDHHLASTYQTWSALEDNKTAIDNTDLATLFAKDSNRASRFLATGAGIELDFSKNLIDEVSFSNLCTLAREAGLEQAIEDLLNGEQVNNTEARPALHTALRDSSDQAIEQETVHATLQRMDKLIQRIHSGQWQGFDGKKITDVVNIGIGGSDLGPRMVTKALTPYHTKHVNVHFVANVDAAEISDLLAKLRANSTLFIIASKSFSTQETLENAMTARKWVLAQGCPTRDLEKHFIAISSKVEKAKEFGIAPDNVYPLWDWVGGRYSLWSAIGLPIACAVGMENFRALLKGAETMDRHFKETPLEKNIPVIMGLIVFWYSQFYRTSTQAVLPYAYHLQLLPAYLQQLEMESNGKCVTKTGEAIDYPSGSIVWGTEGTNGQHSFHQLLHQGTHLIPIDFIAVLTAHHDIKKQNELLFANCVAQSQALMTGRDAETSRAELVAKGVSSEEAAVLAPHKAHPGNRPSNTIILEQLNPETLGALIAAYEHKVYTLGVLLKINSYDQWGVELGKLLGNHVHDAIETTDIPGDWDSSTRGLVERFCKANL